MNLNAVILGLTAETPIHAGASSASHVIDLPIMREHNTGWPVVFGSAVKGALRAKAESSDLSKPDVTTLFGPDTNSANEHAGSLMIGDARLLLLPVRSLTTQFRYVTCPDLLHRWSRDRQRAGVKAISLETIKPEDGSALVHSSSKAEQLFLEEFLYHVAPVNSEEMDALISELSTLSGRSVKELEEKLTIVSNDQFSLLCRAAIPVNARISIDNQTKTVKDGGLWYEESLPPETVLYSVVAAQPSRSQQQQNAMQLVEIFCSQLLQPQPYLQLGGNETTGMGWCKLQLLKHQQEA